MSVLLVMLLVSTKGQSVVCAFASHFHDRSFLPLILDFPSSRISNRPKRSNHVYVQPYPMVSCYSRHAISLPDNVLG
jgi:hypothetical protein